MTSENDITELFKRLLLKTESEVDAVVMPPVGGGITRNENEFLIRSWHKIANARGSIDFEVFFTPDYVGNVRGSLRINLAELRQLEHSFATSFSEITCEIDSLFSAGDKVVLRSTTQATHSGESPGIKATGRIIRLTSFVIYQFRDARIAMSWGEFDSIAIWRQLRRRELSRGK